MSRAVRATRIVGRRMAIGCCCVFAAALAGCKDGYTGPKSFPVRGTVVYNDAPLAEAMVTFHRLDAGEKEFNDPVGITDAEGRFEMTTVRVHDGTPPGKYAITVELRDLRLDGDEWIRDGANLLPDKYRNPKTSGFEFVVAEEENDVPPLELTGPPIKSAVKQ